VGALDLEPELLVARNADRVSKDKKFEVRFRALVTKDAPEQLKLVGA